MSQPPVGFLTGIRSILNQTASANLPATCDGELPLIDCSVECETRIICQRVADHDGPCRAVVQTDVLDRPPRLVITWDTTDEEPPGPDAPYNLVQR